MKRVLVLLSVLFTIITASGQYIDGNIYNPDPKTFNYATLNEAINTPALIGQRVYVAEKGVGGFFNIVPKIGLTEDSIFSFDKHDASMLVRDTTGTNWLNVLWAGAKNDSISDNYYVFQRIAKYVNKRKGHITLYYPSGYYSLPHNIVYPTVIDTSYEVHTRDSITGDDTVIVIKDTLGVTYDTVSNNITDIQFVGCEDLSIIADGAVILPKGDFMRKTTKTLHNGAWKVSNYTAISPFVFYDCKRLYIRGITVDGNAQLMTQDNKPGYLIEASAYGLKIASCDDVIVLNCKFKNIQTDGVYIDISSTKVNGIWHASTNVQMTNVISLNSHRQGITIGNLNTASFVNCHFDGTGMNAGSSPVYAPQKSMDIEPIRFYGINIDLPTENITFKGCSFDNSVGGSISLASAGTVRNIFFENCHMDNSNLTNGYAIISAANNAVYDGCVINTGKGQFYATWANGALQRVVVKNCTITSASSGIMSAANPQFGSIYDHNTLVGVHDTSYTGYFPYINSASEFTNNVITLDSNMYRGTNSVKSLVQYCTLVRNNKWLTTLDTAYGKRQYVSYTGSTGITGERYLGAIASFTGANWPFTQFPTYTTGVVDGGSVISMDNGAGTPATFRWGTGKPTSGYYTSGSFIFMRNPSTAGVAYWQCTGTGTAGVDATFAPGPTVSATGGTSYKAGFVTDIYGNVSVGDSTRNLNSTFRQSGRTTNLKNSIWTTGSANDTGMIVFKAPLSFSLALHATIKGTIVNAGRVADYTADFTPLGNNTFAQASLSIKGDSGLLAIKVRLLKDSINNYYLSFFDSTTISQDRTTISIDRVQLTGIGAVFANVSATWQPFLLTSLNGYSIATTLVNTTGTNWNYIVNKPAFATVATTGNYNDLINKPSNTNFQFSDSAIQNKPTAIQNAKFNIYNAGGGNHIANAAGLTQGTAVPLSGLDITVSTANFNNVAYSASVNGATSGINVATTSSNAASVSVGGYQASGSTYRAQETSMTSLEQVGGVINISGKTGLTAGSNYTLDKWGIFNSVGLSLDGTATTTSNLKLKASTTALSSMRVPIAGAVLPTSPTGGDFGSDGTDVLIRKGTGWINITNPSVSLTTNVTGILPIANGGTNNTTFTSNRLNYFDGAKIASSTVGVDASGNVSTTGTITASNISDLGVLTTAQRDALTPTIGQRLFNSDNGYFEYYSGALFGWMPIAITNEWRAHYGNEYFREFVNTGNDAVITQNLANSGVISGGGAPTGSTAESAGAVQLQLATTSTARSGYNSQNFSYVLGSGATVFETRFRLGTLSTSTDRYTFVTGLYDNGTGLDQVDGVYLLYDEGGLTTGSTASANFQLVTSSNSVRTFQTTTTAVTAGTWYTFREEINAAGTQATFYLNGTQIGAAMTTNIPTTITRATGWGIMGIKSVGTTTIPIYLNFMDFKQKFSTPR